MGRPALILAALLALLDPSAADAQRELRIRSFDALLEVRSDGSLDVTETLRVAFRGEWNGILRDVSVQHATAEGWRRRLSISDLRATDAAGAPLESWRESGEDGARRLRIRVPGARDAERTVVVHYRVGGALRHFFGETAEENYDELYWNVTGNGWEIPIDAVTARVVLPPGAAPHQEAAYTGYAGSTVGEATVTRSADGVGFATTRGLAPGEGLTVAVGWPPGAVTARPTEGARRALAAGRLWPLSLPFLAFLVGFRQWHRHGRDPARQSIVAQFEPPDGLSPAEVGTLIDNQAGIRDVTSTLVDLAVRGYVGIEEEVSTRVLGLIRNREYAFHLRHQQDTSRLQRHEQLFLGALKAHAVPSGRSWAEVRGGVPSGAVGGGAVPIPADPDDARQTRVVRLGDLKERFYTALPGIRTALYERLIERGYYLRRPDSAPAPWIFAGATALMAGIGGAILAAERGMVWVAPGAVLAAGIVSALVLFGFGAFMAARTEPGARAREACLGFREFLHRVESDRYRRMITSPELFERYLPYAMAFGVADRWARAFEGLYREPPGWYAGGSYDGFRVAGFTSDLVRMNSAAQSTLSSSPSSSGSGGGGSSGGGSGGGGGGGW
jgi:hypothetical protein